MHCLKCKGKTTKNGFEQNGDQKYKCTVCNYPFNQSQVGTEIKEKPIKSKIGMSLNEFREKHDVDYIVQKTLDKLSTTTIYEKNDVIKLCGLRAGYPGLSPTIEDAKKYYGKVGSVMYFSHPNTIAELKEQAKLM